MTYIHDIQYITDRIIGMAYPAEPLQPIAELLGQKHGGTSGGLYYMIWNISEETYDYSIFENQVGRFGWMDGWM